MLTTPLQVESCSPCTDIGDHRRVATRESHTITAVVTDLCSEAGGRVLARLNAFVDGIGHRTLYVDLDAYEYQAALRTLINPGTLVRASGELVTRGHRLLLLHTRGLRFLEAEPDDRIQ